MESDGNFLDIVEDVTRINPTRFASVPEAQFFLRLFPEVTVMAQRLGEANQRSNESAQPYLPVTTPGPNQHVIPPSVAANPKIPDSLLTSQRGPEKLVRVAAFGFQCRRIPLR